MQKIPHRNLSILPSMINNADKDEDKNTTNSEDE